MVSGVLQLSGASFKIKIRGLQIKKLTAQQ